MNVRRRLLAPALIAIAGAAGVAGCGGGSSTLTPPQTIVLQAAMSKTCVYPSTQAQTVTLVPAGGVSGTVSVGAFAKASQTCLAITLSTGADATAVSPASSTRLTSDRRTALATTAAQNPLLTISITDAFAYGFVVTGMTLTTPSNLNFPDGTYYATISDQTNRGYVFTAKNGTLTLSSTPAQFLVTPFDTATLTLYPRGYVPVFSTNPTPTPTATAVPTASPTATATAHPTATPSPTPVPSPTHVPTATPSPTASPVPTATPTATPSASLILNTGPFTNTLLGTQFTSETVNAPTASNGSFVVTKAFSESGVAYTETFSIENYALIANPSTGTGPNPPTYTDNPNGLFASIELSDDANYEFSNLTITPAPAFGGVFDDVGLIYIAFPNGAVESMFAMKFAAYIAYLEANVPYIHAVRRR